MRPTPWVSWGGCSPFCYPEQGWERNSKHSGFRTLSFPLREAKFGGLKHIQAGHHQVIFQGSRAEGTASHPWLGVLFHVMQCDAATQPPACLQVRGISSLSKDFKWNHHSQSAEGGGHWYLSFQHCTGGNGVNSVMDRVRKPGVNSAPLGLKVNCKSES